MEPTEPTKKPFPWRLVLGILRKVLGFVIMALIIGRVMDVTAKYNNPDKPAGFWWGAAHGALMPAALPALAMGQNLTIYAPNNPGRIYNLGYSAGVNGCGLLFFGLLFWKPTPKDKPNEEPVPDKS